MALSKLRSVSQLRTPVFAVYDDRRETNRELPRKDVAIYCGELVPNAVLEDCPNCMCKFNTANPDDYTLCTDGLRLCEACVAWLGTCNHCGEAIAVAGDWDLDCGLHVWASDWAPSHLYCGDCRGEGMYERTIELGELDPYKQIRCLQCGNRFPQEQAIPDGYTDEPLCPRCSAPCSVCARQVLCDGQSGVKHDATQRSRCAMCITPKCTECNVEVGLVAQMCFSTGDGSYVCALCQK